MQNPDKFKDYYLYQSERVESFKNHWPYNNGKPCSVEKMAEAGFYWTGNDNEPDTATCFVCKKTLDGWEATDDPWKEHIKHAPQCLFVKIGRQESLLTVQDYIQIFQEVVINKVTSIGERVRKELETFATAEKDKFISNK